MVRIVRGNIARNRRKRILFKAKGFVGSHSILYRVANQQVMKALKYAYIDRRVKKRKFRQLWILRINLALQCHNISYNKFIYQLKCLKIDLNRKMLAQLALYDNLTFTQILKRIKKL